MVNIRKLVTVSEEILSDGGRASTRPVHKVAAVAVIENPFAGGFVEDLTPLVDAGLIAAGRAADLVICDAPIGSVARDALAALAAGDLPGISMVMIDGAIRIGRSRNTPPAARAAAMVKGHGPAPGGH